MNAGERRAWLFPPVAGWFQGIDLSLLDPDDEDERRTLIAAEHPELTDAVASDRNEIVVGGQPMSPRLHVAMHELVANQLWHDDPPEMWRTAERLVATGYERHDVLHMLGSVAAAELWHIGRRGEAFDRNRYAAALAALPGSWTDQDDDDGDDEDGLERPRLPDGTILTHRLTGAEATSGSVAYGPDLEALDPLIADHGHLHLVGGAVAEPEVEGGREVLAGPPGWLGTAGVGDLIGFRIAGDEVEVTAVDPPPAIIGLCDRLRVSFDRLNDGDGMPVPVAELLADALAHPAGPAPPILPPLGELLPACGFEVRAGYAAREGADWETFGRIRATAAVAALHGLGADAGHALVLVAELYRLVAAGEVILGEADAGTLAEVATLVADGDIGRAFVDVARTLSDDADLAAFLEGVLRGAPRQDRGGVLWTMSVAATAAADHAKADTLLRRALDADPDHRAALEDAAWCASDRGDASRALELLGRLWQLGEEDADQRAAVLHRYAARPAALAGRNERCPCGSGRKYKHCCQRTATMAPLPDRVRWIWEKLDWFLSRTARGDLDDVLDVLGGDDAAHAMLAASLVLFRDGVVNDFLSRRGPLLPDDERNLVAQWALVDHSVHEVVAIEPGSGVTMRDIRNGDVLEVRERRGSAHLANGDVVFAHVVPDGAGHQIVGGIVPVPLHLRDPLMTALDGDADAVELADLLAAASAPPEILTTEGEPVVVCAARYKVRDPAALDALDDVLDRDDEGTWSEPVHVDGRAWVRGTVTFDGAELLVSANSEARFARLRDAVESTVPGVELVAEQATPAADIIAARRDGFSLPAPQPVPPEAADAVAAFLREQEERWIDERIPALGGLTPRQAAADPTRREELEALLHEFDRHPPPPGALTFDTGRIRATLGLQS